MGSSTLQTLEIPKLELSKWQTAINEMKCRITQHICLLRKTQTSGTEIQHKLEILTCDPVACTLYYLRFIALTR